MGYINSIRNTVLNMQSISYHKPNPNFSLKTIAWINMMTCDTHLHLEGFIAGASAWFKLHPESTPQDLEKELRKRNLNTHIIAKASPVPIGSSSSNGASTKYMLRNMHKKEDPSIVWQCVYSCRSANDALKELKETWSSYEENFEKLKYAGLIVVDNTNIKSLKDDLKDGDQLKEFSEREKTDMEAMIDGEKIIEIKQMTVEETIKNLYKNVQKHYGKEPDMKLFGMGTNGQPVFAFTVDGKLVADIGVMFDAVKQEKSVVKIM